MHVADAILNLPDNLGTLVSPTEDRMQPDELFRIGLTRGLIKKPKLILAEEPSQRVNLRTEMETCEALLQLRNQKVTIVTLAKRLSTLRSADQILVLHDHKLAGVGTHSELLESSEIYRHLNYLQFSSFVDA
jgi:ABC-type multidrug transport system fused ATPase/permease subunit